MTALYQDILQLARLVKKYYQVICVSSVAVIVMVMAYYGSFTLSFDFVVNRSASYRSFLLYGIVPLVCLCMLTRKSPLRLGLGLGDVRFWLPASLLYLTVALPILFWGATQSSSVASFYSPENDIDWGRYLLGTTLYMLGWEYLFRGFLIEGLRKDMKEGAILLQMIPFTLLHLGKPEVEVYSCIVSGLVWGYICYRGKSFWPAFLMHMTVNVAITAQAAGLLF